MADKDKKISVPWTETIIDPVGTTREVTVDVELSIEDIWKWRQYYFQGEDAPVSKEFVENQYSNKNAKIGISKRLTKIENWDESDPISQTKRISNLVQALRHTYSKDELEELINHNRDRLNAVIELESASTKDKRFLKEILSKG